MPLTRLDNLLSSKTGKYIYVSPDDFNASDALDNRGNTPLRPFVTIQRAFLEVARYSYVPGVDNDRFDQFTIMLSPGTHYVDNRPGTLDTSDIPVFNFDAVSGEWNDNTILDLSNPNNVFYKFNGRDGGATIPRGTSLVGTDLRRTQVRALYVPDPADKDVPRCALFNVTGGCYFWQFTILDGNPESGPLNGKVYSQLNSTELSTPLFSHHKMTNFVFADKEDLSLLYRKISKCFSKYQTAINDVYASEISTNGGRVSDTWDSGKTYATNDTTVFGGNAYQALSASTNQRPDLSASWKILTTISREFEYRIQENRIVGPLADTIELDDVTITEPTPGALNVTVKTKINHGFFPGQYVAIANTGFSTLLEGVFQVIGISTTNPKEFTYRAYATLSQVSFASGQIKVPNANATVQAEIDSVESASPYVFNVSIRSTWGICGIWADGRKATGFKSMVIAQYTGVSLQKDDRAFIRYDEFTNTWNQAPLTDAFASTPYHIKGDAYWKDDWRNFHVRASDDSFIQNVSIFAVGFADHFLLESGGDMSITNSNSNFGNTSMHSKGYKGFAFNQDKGGYITDIIPPQAFTSTPTVVNTSYYAFDAQLTRKVENLSKLYIAGDTSSDYLNRPAASINGYKLGARTYINSSKAEKIYTKISADTANGEINPSVKEEYVYPQGFKKWSAALTTLSPDGLGIGNFDNNPLTNEVQDLAFYNRSQDAANLIDLNKTFIQAEAFGYVIEKYPYLQNISYINPNIDADTGRYRDASNLIKNNRQEIIDYAFSQMQTAFPTFTVPGGDDKCKRDIGYIVDAIANDLYNGGNSYMVDATKAYFDSNGALITNGVLGEQTQSIFAFNRTRDWAKKAISNLLGSKSLLDLNSTSALTASGTTVTVTVKPTAPHGLKAGDVVTIGGATQSGYNGKWTVLSTGLTTTQFRVTVTTTPAASPATGAYYVSTVTIDPVNDDPLVGRFKDARGLINSNRQEIIDTAWNATVLEYPGIASTQTKCKRDIGYIVDSIAQDLFWGGNEFTVGAVREYFTLSGTPLNNGLLNEEVQSVYAFNQAKELVKSAITNQLTVKNLTISPGPSDAGGSGGNIANTSASSCADVRSAVNSLFAIVTSVIGAGNLENLPLIDNGDWDCANVRQTIDTLTSILTVSLSSGNLANLPVRNEGKWSQVSEASKCKRDIGYIVEAITSDLRLGGNDNTINAGESYFTGTGNFTVTGTLGSISGLTAIITGISSTAQLLAGMSVTKTTGAGAFGDNAIIKTVDSSSQITVEISSGTFTAGAITFKANKLDYIQDERVETLDAYNYVKQLMISSMRNHNTYIPNVSLSTSSSTVTVPSTDGLVVGMKVQSVNTIPGTTGSNPLTNYNDALEEVVDGRVVPKSTNLTTAISTGTYIKRIISSTQFELGQYGTKLSNGLTKLPASNGTANLFFSLESGSWSTALKPSVDNTVIQIYTEYSGAGGECANIKTTLDNYFSILGNVINNGVGSVDRIPSVIATSTFAQRATLFTLSATGAPTDPHYLETGTPVRLVPRAKDGKTVDKRLIRLPRGFDTNKIYYVIAPGRKTDPYNYSTTTAFNAQSGSLQNIMLATSIENAATGIFIYSSETEAVDQDVQIDVYQYVLDVSYDLNKYETTVSSSNLETLVTTEPHVFDIPTSADTLTDTQKYQSVFFKPISSGLPTISGGSSLNPNTEYFVRYVDKYSFKIYTTLAGAVAGSSPIAFTSGFNGKFYTLSNKRRSPLRYDATVTTTTNTTGNWYVMTDPSKITNSSLSIINRIRSIDFATKDKTPDSYFQRLEDNRTVQDRVYRLRYVIPKYLQAVRDPLRGFVIKSRTDTTRKILPQKILLKPSNIENSQNSFAKFSIPNSFANAPGFPLVGQEYLGLDINSQGPGFKSEYDAYNTELLNPAQPTTSKYKYRVKVTTNSKITFYVQSARTKTISGKNFLELTVFDIGIEEQGYKQKIFTTVKISAPQGGNGIFISNTDNAATNNTITWTGATQGSAKVHAYFAYEGQYYLILKDVNTITSTLRYNPFTTTTFSQVIPSGGLMTATLLSEPDFGRSLKENNLYATEGANVYTMTPGDTLSDDTGVPYTIASVEDVEDFENSFYIYDVNTIRRRIYGQQDGIYYLTCVRGNISPYPTGSGVGENFRGYKFSQPISKLYPEFYKDDPEWYKQLDTTLIDPPATVSAADNYVHGLVTVNDAKASITREAILDFVQDTGSKQYNFSGNITKDGKVIDVAIKAQEGTASAGSEGRKIPISGNSLYPTEGRLYVELRRPSIARSGNHTFEYLGFGPGNYSTGFPIRQEVVLTDIQDFYAQAKREDGGIVFYTGLNSNGDLYIGNRKINAITGEETFLESATLVTSSDAGDVIGNFVTEFNGAVTFNDKVSFLTPISRGPIVFETPIFIDVNATIPGSPTNAASPASIEIASNLRDGDFGSLTTNTKTGISYNITLTGNRIKSAVYQFNPRGLQSYSFRTAIENWTPNQLNPYGSGGFNQAIDFGSVFPLVSGDILLKGEQVGFTGSLGWIYANNFATIANNKISTIVGYGIGQNKIRINWGLNGLGGTYTNAEIGISSNYQFRISGLFAIGSNSALNAKIRGTWSIISSGFSSGNTYVDIQLNDYVETGTYSNISSESGVVFSYSNNSWKELGVIGAEAIRTETDSIGNYKIGINTVARAATSAYLTGFVDPATTTPRANLDVVGDAFISGKLQPSGSSFETSTTKTETGLLNGFLVGGFSSAPSRVANLRVDTLNNRVGINTTKSQNVLVVARSSNVATITTLTTHGYSVGDSVTVNISGSTYNTFNGTVTVLASPAPTATTFSYSNSGIVVAATGLPSGTTGTVIKPANDLDRSFVVVGNARITGDFMFESDINVNGGDITTTVTSGTFNFLNQSTFVGTFNAANYAATINIGNSITSGQTINLGTSSSNSIINIGNPATTVSNISKINIGGAYENNESQSYVSINTKSFRTSGDVLLGTQRNLPDSLTIGSTAGTVNFFNTITSTLNFGNAVSTLVMGGQGGTTRIRNSLTVNGSITGNSNITLIGGLIGLNFNGTRSQLGSTGTGHTGSLTPPTSNNVDLVSIITTNSNQIDSPASAVWGSTATNADSQQSFISAGITLPALTGNYYYLPLKNPPTGTSAISVNDFLFINSAPSAGRWPEIVQVDELSQISGSGPYWIKVKRTPLGSFLPKPSNGHLDDTVIYKAIIQFDSTWVTTTINTSDTTISIAEIGGTINNGDYIIIDRTSTDSNDVNGSETGEAIKIVSSSALVSKKFTINDGASPTPTTFFSVDSTNGNTIIGDPNTTSSNGNLSIYGGLSITGGTPFGSSECEKLTVTDKYDTTFQVNTCTGDTIIGNQVARIELVPLVLNNNGTSSYLPSISSILTNYQNSADTTVYAYSDDPTTINVGGPLTTVNRIVTAGVLNIASSLFNTYYLPVESISGFANNDLILVGSITTGVFEIMQLSGDALSDTEGRLIVYRAREGTTQISITNGLTVRKIVKHPESAKLIDIAQRTRTATLASPTTPFLSAILDLGYIVQQKIDYKQYVRLVRGNYSTIFTVPQGDGTIESGRLLGTRHLSGIDENRQNGAFPFRRGNLTLNNDFKMIGGSLVITDSTNRSELFKFFNDDGHAEHSASIGWLANVRGRGDFFLYGAGCPESILISTAGFSPTFSVDSLGNSRVLLTLGVTGVAAAVPSSGISSLSIDNLGVNGVNKFTIKQTGEIDSFGYTSFYTPTGARHTRYVATTSTDAAKILSPNIVYMVNVTSSDTLILTLPSSPKTGDTIKFVEVGGNLSYQTTLVVRAPGTSVKVQGDSTGTLFGGRTTPYPSGELVVQTPNAAFTLVYLGSSDSNGQVGIPSTVQGWWLMEV